MAITLGQRKNEAASLPAGWGWKKAIFRPHTKKSSQKYTGGDGSLCPSPLLFTYLDKSTAVGQGRSPCPSVQMPNKQECSRNPTWDIPNVSWGPALWNDSYPTERGLGASWGRNKSLIKMWRFSVTLAKSCIFSSMQISKNKKSRHSECDSYKI